MTRYCNPLQTVAALAALALPLAACNVDVRRHDSAGRADVDITTPVGDLSVRTNVEAPDTGLAVYPGARPAQDEKAPENANVTVGNSLFGVQVVAAKFESEDPQDRIVEFYRNELKFYGEVTECRGDIDFKGRQGARHPVCREKLFERDLQLVAGPEDQRHIVSVKPRGSGTEFGLVYLKTHGKS